MTEMGDKKKYTSVLSVHPTKMSNILNVHINTLFFHMSSTKKNVS